MFNIHGYNNNSKNTNCTNIKTVKGPDYIYEFVFKRVFSKRKILFGIYFFYDRGNNCNAKYKYINSCCV